MTRIIKRIYMFKLLLVLAALLSSISSFSQASIMQGSPEHEWKKIENYNFEIIYPKHLKKKAEYILSQLKYFAPKVQIGINIHCGCSLSWNVFLLTEVLRTVYTKRHQRGSPCGGMSNICTWLVSGCGWVTWTRVGSDGPVTHNTAPSWPQKPCWNSVAAGVIENLYRLKCLIYIHNYSSSVI